MLNQKEQIEWYICGYVEKQVSGKVNISQNEGIEMNR